MDFEEEYLFKKENETVDGHEDRMENVLYLEHSVRGERYEVPTQQRVTKVAEWAWRNVCNSRLDPAEGHESVLLTIDWLYTRCAPVKAVGEFEQSGMNHCCKVIADALGKVLGRSESECEVVREKLTTDTSTTGMRMVFNLLAYLLVFKERTEYKDVDERVEVERACLWWAYLRLSPL